MKLKIKYLLQMMVAFALLAVFIHTLVMFCEAIFWGKGMDISEIKDHAPIGAIVGLVTGIINIIFRSHHLNH